MANKIEQFQELYRLLKISRRGQEVPTISHEQEGRLDIWSAISGDDEVIIRIELDDQNLDRFAYAALTNKFFSNPEKYLKVEVKDNLTAEAAVEAVYRIIENKRDLQIPKPLID